MKIEDWSRNERNTLTGNIRTEFTVVTFESIGDSQDFLDYVAAYNKDHADKLVMAAKNTDRMEKAHDVWRGHTPEQIIERLDEIFLSLDKTRVLDRKEIHLKPPMTQEAIDVGIHILRDFYGIFYKPESKTLQQVKEEVAKWTPETDLYKWNPETGLEKVPPEGNMFDGVFRSPRDE